jgi:hypothetical protein
VRHGAVPIRVGDSIACSGPVAHHVAHRVAERLPELVPDRLVGRRLTDNESLAESIPGIHGERMPESCARAVAERVGEPADRYESVPDRLTAFSANLLLRNEAGGDGIGRST